jgi:hypothetical protein
MVAPRRRRRALAPVTIASRRLVAVVATRAQEFAQSTRARHRTATDGCHDARVLMPLLRCASCCVTIEPAGPASAERCGSCG